MNKSFLKIIYFCCTCIGVVPVCVSVWECLSSCPPFFPYHYLSASLARLPDLALVNIFHSGPSHFCHLTLVIIGEKDLNSINLTSIFSSRCFQKGPYTANKMHRIKILIPGFGLVLPGMSPATSYSLASDAHRKQTVLKHTWLVIVSPLEWNLGLRKEGLGSWEGVCLSVCVCVCHREFLQAELSTTSLKQFREGYFVVDTFYFYLHSIQI